MVQNDFLCIVLGDFNSGDRSNLPIFNKYNNISHNNRQVRLRELHSQSTQPLLNKCIFIYFIECVQTLLTFTASASDYHKSVSFIEYSNKNSIARKTIQLFRI